MTDQGSEETPTTNVPTPPVAPPAESPPPPPDPMPTFQQPAAYQPPAFEPPPAAYPPQPGVPPPGYQQPAYQQPTQPGWGQPPAQGGPGWGQPQQPAGPAWGQPQQPPPGQPGWGQPQPPAGPAWGQPQQPPPGQPGWGQPQPQYWGQPGAAVDYGHGTSVWAIIAGIPLLLYGLLITLAGAAVLFLGTALDDLVNRAGGGATVTDAVHGAVTFIAVFILIIGILQILAAIGIWAHKGWGRWMGIVFGVLGTLFGLAALGGSRSSELTNSAQSSNLGGALFILVPYGFVLIAMIIGGRHFHRRRA